MSLFDGTVDSDVFYAWIRQDLLPLPKLPERSVIVMDNAFFHKRRDIREAVKNAGHLIEYMPVYSPGLNPVEHKWAQAKALRKKHRCSVDELFQRYKLQSVYIAPAIAQFSQITGSLDTGHAAGHHDGTVAFPYHRTYAKLICIFIGLNVDYFLTA